MAADALTDIDLGALARAHRDSGWIATLATKRVPNVSEYGVVVTGSDGRVQGFQEKPEAAASAPPMLPETTRARAAIAPSRARRRLRSAMATHSHRLASAPIQQSGQLLDVCSICP